LPQAGVSVGDATAGRLSNVNAACEPIEDAAFVPSRRSSRLREYP
jgi:hypothetical protein